MRIERQMPIGYAAEADWRRAPSAETAATAVASVGKTEAAESKLRQEGGQTLALRAQERISGLTDLASQTSEALARARQSLSGSQEDNSSLLDAMSALLDSSSSSESPNFYHIFPPLPSPLADVRAALKAYTEQGATNPDDDVKASPQVKQLLKDASDLLAGNGGVAQTLASLRVQGASTPQIEQAMKELQTRVDKFRDKLSLADTSKPATDASKPDQPSQAVDLKA